MPAVFSRIDKLKPFYDVIYKIVNTICKILLTIDVLVTIYMVIGRYVPAIPAPVWGE